MDPSRQWRNLLIKLGPPLTAVIIIVIMNFTYQLMEDCVETVFLLYFFITQIFGNWFLFHKTKSYIPKNSGNSQISSGLSHSDCKELCYCPICEIYKPERSHHCPICDRCIHQRDHHCFYLGTCVGATNLSYFVCFCFYACIGCAYAVKVLYTHHKVKFGRQFLSSEFQYYLYPVTIVHWFLGTATFQEVVWVTLLCMEFSIVLVTAFFVVQQLTFIARGQTSYEYNKGMLRVHRSSCHNFSHVFGRFWILRCILPLPRKMHLNKHQSFLKIV